MYAHSAGKHSQDEQIKLFKLRKPDVIVNAAGPTSIIDSVNSPDYYRDVPVAITKFLLQASENLVNMPTILQISTAAVYGECKHSLANETSILNPLSPYAEGKALSDEILMGSGSDWLIVRATSIYSNSLEGRVLGRLRNALTMAEPIVLGGSGRELRDFMHLKDFTNALYTLVESMGCHKNIYLLGSGESIQISEVAEIAVSAQGKSKSGFSVLFDQQTREGDPFAMQVDTSKLLALGFTPSKPPRIGLAEYFKAKR